MVDRQVLQVRRVRLDGADQGPVLGASRRVIVVTRDLVLRADLPGQAQVKAAVLLRLGARGGCDPGSNTKSFGIDFVERVGANLLVSPEAVRRPEPQFVLTERTAEREAGVVDVLDTVGGRHALRAKRVVDVVGLQRRVCKVGERQAAEQVAALARNDIDADTSAAGLGGNRAELVTELLRRRVVGRDAGAGVVARHVGDHQAVELHDAIVERPAVRLELVLMLAGRAADIVLVAEHADRQHTERRPVLRCRHRLDHFSRDDLPLDHVRGVDQRAFTRHGDRLFEGADFQVDVDGRGKRRRQLNLLAPDGGESRQREGHRVDTGPQIDDVVAALRIGHRATALLDQRRAGRLDGHTRQHAAARVTNDAGDTTGLCMDRGRKKQRREREQADESSHGAS